MKVKAGLLSVFLAIFGVMPVFAGSASFNFTFGGHDKKLNKSESYMSGSATITAYAYQCSATTASSTDTLSHCGARDLYQKDDGGAEIGLGLAGENEHEIGWDGKHADFVMGLDVSELFKLGATSMTLSFGSVQPGEAFAVLGYSSNPFAAGTSFALTNTEAWCGYQTAGCTYDPFHNGDTVSATFRLNAQDQFLVLVSPCGASGIHKLPCGSNVLLESAHASSPTPEPGTLALLGMGLLGLAFVARRSGA